MHKEVTSVKRALISVSDKTGIVDFAKGLVELGVDIVSTGGTYKLLSEQKIPVTEVSEMTGFPEIMDGRVKTLHPKVHGGILGLRDEHAEQAKEHDIDWFDLVVCNLYPFANTIAKDDVTFDDAVENIDIGGPSMVRAAAKNMGWASVIVDSNDYPMFLDMLREQQGISFELRHQLATKAFLHTAHYDSLISRYLVRGTTTGVHYPQQLTMGLTKHMDLRYGENPHQSAAVYVDPLQGGPSVLTAKQHQGKQLSYNNIVDADSAIHCVAEYDKTACVVVKHANPCGVACADTMVDAFKRAFNADSQSAFGGIVAFNRTVDEDVAAELVEIFFEIIIAPEFTEAALKILSEKKNLRVLSLGSLPDFHPRLQMKTVYGGALLQEVDNHALTTADFKVATKVQPSEADLENLLFAWRALKYVKSNGILIAKDEVTLSMGHGQVSRVGAVELAIGKVPADELKGAALASDAFFPFRDSIDRIAQAGVTAIIQPAGGMRLQEVIDACDEHGLVMVLTDVRCFNH